MVMNPYKLVMIVVYSTQLKDGIYIIKHLDIVIYLMIHLVGDGNYIVGLKLIVLGMIMEFILKNGLEDMEYKNMDVLTVVIVLLVQ